MVEQLTALGVSPAQITKKLRVLKRPQVDAALQVAGSETAMAAADAYDLTLEQAAGLAEFDTDPEATEVLLTPPRRDRAGSPTCCSAPATTAPSSTAASRPGR